MHPELDLQDTEDSAESCPNKLQIYFLYKKHDDPFWDPLWW